MAKAGGKSTTKWILLSKARARAVLAFGSPEFAQLKLTEWLLAGTLHARSLHPATGSKKETDPGPDDPKFWQDELVDIPPSEHLFFVGDFHRLFINWDESRAERDSYKFYAI